MIPSCEQTSWTMKHAQCVLHRPVNEVGAAFRPVREIASTSLVSVLILQAFFSIARRDPGRLQPPDPKEHGK